MMERISKVKEALSRGQASWNLLLVVLLVLEFVVFGAANPKFLRPALLFTSINDNLAVFMVSLFVCIVMVTGGIDIQVASLMGLTSITIGVGWQDFDLPVWGAVSVALLLVMACGALSGFLIAYCRVQAMVVTLGGSFLYSGVALLISTLSSTESYRGIGGMSEGATVLRDGILSKNELALLKVQGAVGDMLNHFLDATGEPMASSIEGRSISTGLDRLQAMDNVVGVAGGPAKLEAMRAVLRHGYLNVLITDVATAEGLLEDPKGG